MFIVELIKPGISVVNDDAELEARLFQTLNAIISSFYHANMALNLFEESLIDYSSHVAQNFENFDTVMERRNRAEIAVRSQRGLKPFESYEGLGLKIQQLENRERWNEGYIPFDLTSHIPDIYANAFLHAFDAINKYLKSLTHDKILPSKIDNIYVKFKDAFPDLEGIRNSIQHKEQRIKLVRMRRGVPEKIDLKPFDIGIIKSEGDVLIGEARVGNVLMTTMENGELGRIEVSQDNLLKLGDLIQELLNGFVWVGNKQILPR